jgi:hypothetical protein
VKFREYSTRLEAELVQARLESENIPATIQAHAGTGVFGPGFQGMIPGGVTVLVPTDRRSRAEDILDPGRDLTG